MLRYAQLQNGLSQRRVRVKSTPLLNSPFFGTEIMIFLGVAVRFHFSKYFGSGRTTQSAPAGIDWICVSPKAGTELALTRGHELKLVYPQVGPQVGAEPESFLHLDFQYFFLQPMDGAQREANTQAAVAYCLAHPGWRLSLQTHKLLSIP